MKFMSIVSSAIAQLHSESKSEWHNGSLILLQQLVNKKSIQ